MPPFTSFSNLFLLPSWSTAHLKYLEQTLRLASRAQAAKTTRKSFSGYPRRLAHQKDHSKEGSDKGRESLAGSVSKKISLLEELFPEQAKKLNNDSMRNVLLGKSVSLNPPGLEAFDESDTELVQWHAQHSASPGQKDTTILVLHGANSNLVEADFRRIIPRGEHIGEWRSPGDILKVIPGRSTETLERNNKYYLLFSNGEFAKSYQTRLQLLHKLSQTYTPKDILSAPIPPPGILEDGEDINQVLADYSICPPSQKLTTQILFPPYTMGVRRLIDHEGYEQITRQKLSGCSVLFSINNYGTRPSASLIRAIFARDGTDRGLQWAPFRDSGTFEKVKAQKGEGAENGEEGNREFDEKKTDPLSRWIISFEDETEARRFVRAWHMKPFPIAESDLDGEALPLASVEFMW